MANADASFQGEADDEKAWVGLSAAGDMNGDGYADFLISAPGNDDGASGAGAVYFMLGGGI